jgi:anti-anti-sigma factor
MAESAAQLNNSNTKVRTLEIVGEEGQLSRVRDFVIDVCTEAGFSPRETNNTKLAVDEACTNIIKHAYDSRTGNIDIKAVIQPGSVDISLTDTGEKFDFASVKDPDLDQYVESGRKGGLGVFLINRLMDKVNYRVTESGNEITLSKRSHTAISRTMPGQISYRDSLRFKFTLRASIGLFMLVAIITVFTLAHQTRSIKEQKTTQWLERRRLAENLANKSKDLLLSPESYSIEQTNLSAYLSKLLESNESMSYAHVVSPEGEILSSSRIDDIFSAYIEPAGERLLVEENQVVWLRYRADDRFLQEIAFPVRVRDTESNRLLTLGTLYLGVFEDAIDSSIEDSRVMTILLLIGIFLLGILSIMLLVSIFVKPIQLLTDGVRAIGEGSFDGQISVEGPAEIGAIASVFNEITHKFKKAQVSIREQEKLQKEMEVAKEIQQSLLPKKMPDVSGYDIAPLYQAAAEVGGDYYDFVEVDDDTIGVVVADVSGKGVPGSLVMTMIRTALRMEARGNKNASDVMAKMNEFVTNDMKKGMFVTMFYVILDSQNRIISYASAGHNPMILYRYETNETFFLNPRGFPVGISLPDEKLFRKSINVEKIKLKKDDMLLIYTDGVTEAMNTRREQYGENRLLGMIKQYGHLHPKAFIDKLDGDIKKFTGGHPQNDDITIVAVKEKLAADDVLYGIRKRLIELVDVEGMSVREACRKMKVSPATYYRYKKRHELLGERGLKDKVLRKDVALNRVSLEARKEIFEILRMHPEYGSKKIADEINKQKEESRKLTERMVYEELKRLNLNTKDLRLEYLKRYRLVSEEETLKTKPDGDRKKLVEEFLAEVSEGQFEGADGKKRKVGDERPSDGSADIEEIDLELESEDDAVVRIEKKDGDITILHVNGHLDSVSTGSFENILGDVIRSGGYKLIVDLSDVSYISSGGWGIFTGEVKKLREKGGDVVLAGMTPEVYDVFDLLGFGEILVSFYSVDEALTFLRKSPEERLARNESGSIHPGKADPVARRSPLGELEFEETIPGESYVPEWESLKIEAATVGKDGDIAVLSLDGIIDTVSAENMRKALEKIISRDIYKIVIDMSQVEYVSSGGWGTFTERLREVRRAGGDIKLFGMDPDVYYVFTMLGFNIVLSSFDILGEAIGDFSNAPSPKPASQPGRRPAVRRPEPPPEPEAAVDEVSDLLKRTPALPLPSSSGLIRWETPEYGILIGYLEGAVEATVIEKITGETDSRLSDGQHVQLLIFDLANVSYVSSAGWGVFAQYYERLDERGGTVGLSGLPESLYEIYRCLEFQAFLRAYPSPSEAIGSLWTGAARPAQAPLRPDPRPDAKAHETPGEDRLQHERELEQLERDIDSIDDLLSAKEVPKQEIETPADDTALQPSNGITGDEAREETVVPEESYPDEDRTEKLPEWIGDDDMVTIDKSLQDDLLEEDWMTHNRPDPVLPEGAELDVNEASRDDGVADDSKLRKLGWGKYGEKLKKKLEKTNKKPKKES